MALRGIKSASVVAVLACGAALSACGSSGDAPAKESAGSGAAARYNAADVVFVQAMVIHHRQGVQVAGMAPTRAVSAQIKGLASTIVAADQPEVDTLTGWLRAWGAAVPAADTADDGSGDPAGLDGAAATTASGQPLTVAGLLTSEAVIELGNGHGRAWDQQFLQDMSSFQAGAVRIARAELAHGANADARALAQKIVATDSAEVTQMQRLMAG